MEKVLIIKTGAAGDIVRTTILLNVLKARVTWVTDDRYVSILPGHHPNLERILPMSLAAKQLTGETFDRVLSLEEDRGCAALAASMTSKKLTGVTLSGSNLTYTGDSASWFDMSLISAHGQGYADKAKAANKASFQDHLCRMVGERFNGEPYSIYRNRAIRSTVRLVGIEARAGKRWPNKTWAGYHQLKPLLEEEGFAVIFLSEKKSIREYLDDIAGCDFIISGDTLAMHVAMAYQKPSVAIFNCTSPDEIYDYGTMHKVISPMLEEVFYCTEYIPCCTEAVSVHEVFRAAKSRFIETLNIQ